jgi:hypothetical protein|uniref:Uncharacterized protein n=1 Tax=Siphoviridae sp. ctHEr2 TaxID=2826229 RepID=A0A8S5NFD4_9CAUD|nr:MAG TPA: hypothetical protein [Siphoviridae sp. ctHEr2]
MAKIKGSLEAANTTLILTLLADTSAKLAAERWRIPPHVEVDFELPDGFYNVESVGGLFDIELRKIVGEIAPDSLVGAGSGGGGGAAGPGSFLKLRAGDPVPAGTPSGTLIVRVS